jgi:hypothetical protein
MGDGCREHGTSSFEKHLLTLTKTLTRHDPRTRGSIMQIDTTHI